MEKFLESIKEKYNYSEDVMKAIAMSYPLFVEQFHDEKEVQRLFETVRIFATGDMSRDNRDRISDEMTQGIKKVDDIEEVDPYQNDRDPGSYYSFETIYDDDMNPISEVKWLVVEDLKGTYRESNYQDMFGTSINMPYFIHELGHAYAMMNAEIVRDGDVVSARHGMYTTKDKLVLGEDGVYRKEHISDDGIIFEEGLNEYYTQEMLVKLMHKENYNEVNEALRSINHVGTSYNVIITSLCGRFSNLIGIDQVMDLRKNNNTKVIDRFNFEQEDTRIKQEFFPDEKGFDYLSNKLFELFQNGLNKYRMSPEEYGLQQRKAMFDAYAPILSVEEKRHGSEKYDVYIAGRKENLGEEKKEEQVAKIN